MDKGFEQILVWKKARQLNKEIYQLTSKNSFSKYPQILRKAMAGKQTKSFYTFLVLPKLLVMRLNLSCIWLWMLNI